MNLCVMCSKGLVVNRTIFNGETEFVWKDRKVCDECATAIRKITEAAAFKRMKLANLRAKRRTQRQTHCRRCKNSFWFNRGGTWPTLCPKCAARIKSCLSCNVTFETDDPKAECCSVTCSRNRRALIWWCRLPPVYSGTEKARLPNILASDAMLSWDGESELPGLYAFGPTGTGKTRTAHLCLRRFIESGDEVRYLRSAEFARELIERTRPGGIGGAGDWLSELRGVGVLCLDEVEKLKFSERVEAEFFELVEMRLSDELPTMFVGNASPRDIANRMQPAFSDAFFRRITEFCFPVRFTLATKSPNRTP